MVVRLNSNCSGDNLFSFIEKKFDWNYLVLIDFLNKDAGPYNK